MSGTGPDQGAVVGQGPIMQTAFVTTDIHGAMAEHTRATGAGPWFLRERGVFANQVYRGQPVQTELSIAMAYSGDMLIELIQKHDTGPSVYDDLLGKGGAGLHHFGIETTDPEGDTARRETQGFALVYSAEVAHGSQVLYFERPGLPYMIELIELRPASRAMFATIREAHAGWDSRDPVRPLSPAGT